MKSIITPMMVTILLASLNATAQTRFGFNAGASFSMIKAKVEGVSISYDFKPGFTTGIFADIPLSEEFSFQPALNFVQKGGTYKEESFFSTSFSTSELTLNYLEVPLNFIYYAGAKKRFFMGAGPAMSFGLSGNEKYSDEYESAEEKIEFGSGDDELNPFELSANMLAGFRLTNGLMFSAGYNIGLTSMANSDSDESTVKSSYFSVKFGWMLPGKRISNRQ